MLNFVTLLAGRWHYYRMSIVKMHVDEKEYSCCVYLCLDRYKPK